MPADTNRVQQYLASQRGPQESALDVGLFLRDVADPSTSDDDVKRSYDELRAQGKSDPEIGQAYLGAAQKHVTGNYVQQRSDAMKRYTDANERTRAVSEAETGVQKVARIIAELGNAYTGGQPGAITATIQKYKDSTRARADKLAGDTFAFELSGIDDERQDARAAATLTAQAERDRRARSATAKSDEEKRNFDTEQKRLDREATITAAGATREFTAEQNKLGREATLAAAGARADAKPPTEDQAKAATFATLMDEGMRSIEASGYNPTASTARVERTLPPEGQSPEYQRYRQGVRLFAAAWLRRISGAAVTPAELDDVDQQFFPQPGEDPSLVDQKRRSRDVVIQALKHSAGKAMPSGGDAGTPPPAGGAGGEVQTRMVGGQPVKVRKRPDGKWEEVQ